MTAPVTVKRRRDRRAAGSTGFARRRVILGAVPVGSILIAWVVVTEALSLANPLKVPYPSALFSTVSQMGSYIFVHTGATSLRLYSGFALGVAVGVLCGLAMAWSPRLDALLDPIIEILRPIPALAFIPFFILWMGIGDPPKILLVAMGCFLTMVVTTLESARNQPRDYLRAARTLGATDLRIYRTVVLPGIFPLIFPGIRLSAGLAFTLVVAAEFMGAQQGLGYLILVAQRTLDTSAMLYGIIVIAALSYVTDYAIRKIGGHIMRWTDRAVAA